MADRPRTRQEIYDRIRETSKDEFVLEDMIRLGFWPDRGRLPQDPADEIRRRGELQRELDKLREESRRLHNEKALLQELRKERLKEALRKRKETKERHERERKERAAAWRARGEHEIGYLGQAVSGGLGNEKGDAERLRTDGLPSWSSAEEIAAAMGIAVGALRFLSFSRQVSRVSHYVRFHLPKKTGGQRLISAPMPRLLHAQDFLRRQILDKVALHEAAHGFRPGRSIVSNALPHVGREVVINIDLKDFFPTVGYKRVKGLFRALGYSEAAATIFALLCTEPEVEQVELDGTRYFVALSERRLPQGAPTSPALTNILCRRMDRRLQKMAAELGFVYTRYADDLSFSAPGEHAGQVGEVLRRLGSIVAHEGFVVHPDKTRVLRRAGRQEVTGIVVNERPSVPRDVLRRFRATLFQIEKDGPEGKRWGQSKDVLGSVLGFANYVQMVQPDKGAELQARVRRLLDRHGWKQPKRIPPARPATHVVPPAAAAPPEPTQPDNGPGPEKPKKKWWKLW
jgi:retron-type reverse transcriptase